jgi:hypothetical protein
VRATLCGADSKHYDFENVAKHPRRFLLQGLPQIGKTGAFLDLGARATARACRVEKQLAPACARSWRQLAPAAGAAHPPRLSSLALTAPNRVPARAACAHSSPAARFRDAINWFTDVPEIQSDDDKDSETDEPGAEEVELSWAEYPDYYALKDQPFKPLRPGPGKYGDPRDEATWRHYVVDKHAHAYWGSPAAEAKKAAGAASSRSARGGGSAANEERQRRQTHALSYRHWRDTLHARAPEMVDDGLEPTRFVVTFAEGTYGPSELDSSEDERVGQLIVPSARSSLFEETGAGVALQLMGPNFLRFPIFQPSRRRAETVCPSRARAAHALRGADAPPARTRVDPPTLARSPPQGFLHLSTALDEHDFVQIVCVRPSELDEYRRCWPVRTRGGVRAAL